MSGGSISQSIVEYYAEHERYKCGYCKKPDTNFGCGMWGHSLTVADYQDLIDRGWRRSGRYLYKPINDMICCPTYAIRCNATEAKISKSQKKLVKRFNKYLSGELELDKKMSTCSETDITGDCERGEHFMDFPLPEQQANMNVDLHNIEAAIEDEDVTMKDDEKQPDESSSTSAVPEVATSSKSETQKVDKPQEKVKNVSGPDPNKGPCKKAKLMRKQGRLEKMSQKGLDESSLQHNKKNIEKSLEDFLDDIPAEFKNRLKIKMVKTSPPGEEYSATAQVTYELYKKYQSIIHKEEPESHSEHSYYGFLVNSPLLPEEGETRPSCGYGSFHQQYWVDDKLIAVGVIDVLPKCVSSVYFFYDPDYMNLVPGTYGALREIAFTRLLHKTVPDIKYYYMGYYIHSCTKMRYKGHFTPSYLLCSETYKWFPIKDCIPKLEQAPYSRLDPDPNSVDENNPDQTDIDYIQILVKRSIMAYTNYRRKYLDNMESEEMKHYAKLVGAKCALNLILHRLRLKIVTPEPSIASVPTKGS